VKGSFLVELPNPPCGDPAVIVRPRNRGLAVLAEAGDLSRVSPRRLLSVRVALVSHFHVDHAYGLARLLRVRLGHPERPLSILGPPGSAARVAHHLAGYLWNLLPAYPLDLAVLEVHRDRLETWTFPREAGFDPVRAGSRPWSAGEAVFEIEEEGLLVRCLPLDHGGTTSLAWRIDEEEGLHVDPDALARAGLAPGPWLGELKRLVREGAPPGSLVELPGGRSAPLGDLERELLFRTPGDTVAVACDLSPTEENVGALARFARNVRTLVLEAYYRAADAALAREHGHLATPEAGRLAREAAPGRLVPFHFSPRYEGKEGLLLDELRRFAAPVPVSSATPLDPCSNG